MKKFRKDLTASSTARQEGLMEKDWCTDSGRLSKDHTHSIIIWQKPARKGDEIKIKIFFLFEPWALLSKLVYF